jgi:hypothetical protein
VSATAGKNKRIKRRRAAAGDREVGRGPARPKGM